MTRRAILNNSAEELVSWLKVIPALDNYASLIEAKGITGAQMLEIDSDQPLIDLGIESDIDRSEATLYSIYSSCYPMYSLSWYFHGPTR